MAAGKAGNAAEAAVAGNYEATIGSEHLMSDSPKDKGGAMWKWTRKHENKPVPPTLSAAPPARSIPCQESVQTVPTSQSVESFGPQVTHIGKFIVIKGEVSGSENVYLDGELEGSVELLDGSLTVGPDGRIRADLQARNIVIQGRVEGNLYGLERVELKKSAFFVGAIYTPHIAIEDGAFLEGNVRIGKDIPSPQTKKENKERGRHGRCEIARRHAPLTRPENALLGLSG